MCVIEIIRAKLFTFYFFYIGYIISRSGLENYLASDEELLLSFSAERIEGEDTDEDFPQILITSLEQLIVGFYL